MISPRLSSKSTFGYAEFYEYFIASYTTQYLLENLSVISIFNSGLYGTTEQKIKQIQVNHCFEPEKRSNRLAKFDNVSQASYSTKISPKLSMGCNFKCHKKKLSTVYTPACSKIKEYLWANGFILANLEQVLEKKSL